MHTISLHRGKVNDFRQGGRGGGRGRAGRFHKVVSLKGCLKCKVPNITKISKEEAEQEMKNEILFPVETFFYLSAVFDIGFLK